MFVRAAAAIQGQLAQWGASMTGARQWVGGNAGGLRIGAALLAVAYLVLVRYKTVSLVLWTTVGLLVALFVIQIFASDRDSAAITEDDDTETPTTAAATG